MEFIKQMIKKIKEQSKKKNSLYANIDWEKAKELFKQPLSLPDGKRLFPTTHEVLHILAAAGAIGLTFALPKAGATLARMILGVNTYSDWRINQVVSRLRKQKYISIKYNGDGSTTVKITKNGMTKALTYQLDTMILSKPKRWDKKWRVVIFDIPNKYKRVRDVFRMRLLQLDLYQLQESAYISPYPCFAEIEFLRALYGVTFTVRYLLVEKIEDDEFLRHKFDLI